MHVINLFGGPGCGKSTTAAGLFYEMKMANKKVELVTEYAKELFYSDVLHIYTPYCQELIFTEQAHRIQRLKGKVDFAIVDSPLPLSFVYGQPKPTDPEFHALVMATYRQYDNVNFFIDRPDTFEEGGRMQDLQDSIEIDRKIFAVMDKYDILYRRFKADQDLVRKIFNCCLGV